MNRLSHTLLFSPLPLLFAVSGVAQEQEESPVGGTPTVKVSREASDDPDVALAVSRVESVWGDSYGGDAELRAVKLLVAEAEGELSLDDTKRLVRALDGVLRLGELHLPARVRVYQQAITGLSRFGDFGGDRLLDYLESQRIPARPETERLRGSVMVALSKTGHPRVPELLIETVRSSSESRLIAMAGGAMQEWKGAARDVRQPFVELLARRMAGLENVAARRPGDPGRFRDLGRQDAQDDLDSVKELWNPALTALTGERLRTGQEWWEWYQENRGARWPADPEPDKSADGTGGGG